ncbi:MAG: hypothetical protein H8K06_12080 [Nitrospira sp.]|nr:hypothetical protein [Nitrospira sp.]
MTTGIQTWVTRVYTYPAYLIYSSYAALPAIVRDEADQMTSLWNAMVRAYDEAHRQQETLHREFNLAARSSKTSRYGSPSIDNPFEVIERYAGKEGHLEDSVLQALSNTFYTFKQQYDSFQDTDHVCYRSYPDSMKEELSKITKRLHTSLLHLARTSKLSSSHSNAVLERMRTAIRRVSVGGAPPTADTIPPTSLFFSQDFGPEGLRVPTLTHTGTTQSGQVFGDNRRFMLSTVTQLAEDPDLGERSQRDLARTEGAIFVRNIPIPFELILVPLLPKDTILKQVSLIGSQQRSLKDSDSANANTRLRNDTTWQWHIQFTILEPPPKQRQPKKYRMIALDFDHRIVNASGPLVRVGEWVSDTGKNESIFFPARMLKNLIAAHEAREELRLHALAITQLIVRFPKAQEAGHLERHVQSGRPICWKLLRRLTKEITPETENTLFNAVVIHILNRTRALRSDVARRRRQWRRDRGAFYDKLSHRLAREAGTIVLTMVTDHSHPYTRASIASPPKNSPLYLATAHQLNMQELVTRLRHAAPIYGTTLHFVQSLHALIA